MGQPSTFLCPLLVISRMMSKGRTRQLASHDVSVAFFHAWLERSVWVKPPKDLRLSDDCLWYVVKALYGMRESSKAFQKVEGCSHVWGRSEHRGHYLEASPSVVSRGRSHGSGCEACKKSGKSDTKFPSHWSWAARCVGAIDSCGCHGVPQKHGDCFVSRTRQVRCAVCDKGARSRHADAKQVVDAEAQTVCQVSPGAADVGPFFAYQDEPNTVLVWTNGDLSGNVVTCKSTSAGAVQLGSRTIETLSVNHQVVSLSSAEKEFCAIGSGCARGLTAKHALQEILHTVSPDNDVEMTIRTDSGAPRGMIHRVGCGRVRHLQTRYLWHQQALREGQFNVVRCGTKRNRVILARWFWKGRRLRAV